MEAAALGQDLFAGELAADQRPAVADDGGIGKAGDATVGNGHCIGEPLGEEAEPGSEHDGDPGPAAPEPLPNGGNSGVDLAQSVNPPNSVDERLALGNVGNVRNVGKVRTPIRPLFR